MQNDHPNPKKSIWKKRLLKSGIFLLGCSFAVIAFAPALVSSTFGTRFIEKALKKQLSAEISIGSIDLNWMGPQEIHNISFEGKKQLISRASLDILKTEGSLIQFIGGGKNFPATVIQSPQIDINAAYLPPSEHKDQEPPFGTSSKKNLNFKIPFSGEVAIQGGKVLIETGQGACSFSDISLNISAPKNTEHIGIKGGFSSEYQDKKGKLEIDVLVDEIKDRTISFENREKIPQGKIDIKLLDLPINALDDLLHLQNSSFKGSIAQFLGNNAQCNLQALLAKGNTSASMDISTEYLTLNAKSILDPNQLTLLNDCSMLWSIPEKNIRSLLKYTEIPGDAQVDHSIQVTMQLKDNKIAIDEIRNSDFSSVQGNFLLNCSPFKIVQAENIGSFDCKECFIEANFEPNQKLYLKSKFNGLYNDSPFDLDLDSLATNFLEKNMYVFHPDQIKASTQLNISNFPIGFLDRALGQSGLLTELIGKSLDSKIAFQGTKQSAEGKIEITSQKIDLSPIHIATKNNIVSLQGSSTLKYRPSPRLINRFLNKAENQAQKVISIAPVEIKLDSISFNLNDMSKISQNWKEIKAAIEASLLIDQIEFDGAGEIQKFSIENINARITGKDLYSLEALIYSSIVPEQSKNPLYLLIGEKGELQANLSPTRGKNNSRFLLTLNSKNVQGNYESTIVNWEFVEEKVPFSLQAVILPELLQVLKLDKNIQLNDPLNLKFQLQGDRVPLSDFSLSKLHLKGQLDGSPASYSLQGASFSIPKLRAEINCRGENNYIEGSLQSTVQPKNIPSSAQPMQLNWKYRIDNWHKNGKAQNIQELKLNLETHLENISLNLCDSFMPKDFNIARILGPNASITFTGNTSFKDNTPQGRGFLSISSKQLNGQSEIFFDKNLYTKKDSQFELMLTPAGFGEICKLINEKEEDFPISLRKATVCKIQAKDLYLPLTPDFAKNKKRKSALLYIHLDPFELVENKQQKTLKGESFVIELGAKKLNSQLPFSVQGNLKEVSQGQESSSTVNILGELNLLSEQDVFPIKCDASLQKVPIFWVKQFIPTTQAHKNVIAAAIGKYVNTELHIIPQKTATLINAEVSSENIQYSMQGRINKGLFVLDKDIKGTIKLTQEFCQELEGIVSTDLIRFKKIEDPLFFTIYSNGFEIPYQKFSKNRVKIPQFELKPLKAVAEKGAMAEEIFKILRLRPKDASKDMNIWFAPISAKVQNGVLTYERFDFLLGDQLHLASWGELNLLKNDFSSTLGVTAETLAYSQNIQNLPEDYMLQIPIKGNLANFSASKAINWPNILAQVQALRMQKKAEKTGSLKTAIFGVLLQGVAQAEQTTSTPPAKRPFPWELQPQRLQPQIIKNEASEAASQDKPEERQSVKKSLFDLIR